MERKDLVLKLIEKGYSERRACRLSGPSRSYIRYEPKGNNADGMEARVVALAKDHPRYGHRRIWVLLRREGKVVNLKRIHRLCKKNNLQVRKKPRKKIRSGKTVPMKACYANHVWTYDFIFDATMQGRALKCLSLQDEFTVCFRWVGALQQ